MDGAHDPHPLRTAPSSTKQLVDYALDAWRGPCRRLGDLAVSPAIDKAGQLDRRSVDVDMDAARLAHGLSGQCILDSLCEVRDLATAAQRDLVAQLDNAHQSGDRALGGTSLVFPGDLALKRDPTFFDGQPDRVGGYQRVPAQRLLGARGDLAVAAAVGDRQLELHRHSPHACHSAHRRRDGFLFREVSTSPATVTMPSWTDTAIADAGISGSQSSSTKTFFFKLESVFIPVLSLTHAIE